MKIITVASLRGGVGKTTLAVNLAHALSVKKRVLLVDLDSQASATDYFLRSVPVEELTRANAYHVLSERMSASEAIRRDDLFSVHVIPASVKLHTLGAEMAGDPGAMARTIKELRSLPYDVILLDTPPGLSYEFRTGIFAGDIVLSPVTFDRWAVQGLALLRFEMEKAKKSGVKQALKITPSIVTEKEALALAESLTDVSVTPPVLKSAAVKTAMNKGTRLKEAHRSALQFAAVAEAL